MAATEQQVRDRFAALIALGESLHKGDKSHGGETPPGQLQEWISSVEALIVYLYVDKRDHPHFTNFRSANNQSARLGVLRAVQADFEAGLYDVVLASGQSGTRGR